MGSSKRFGHSDISSFALSLDGKRCTRLAAAIVLPAGLLLAGAGGSQVEKSFRTTQSPRISISNPPGGTVVVHGWEKSDVHAVYSTVSSKTEVDVEQMPSNGEADRVSFVTHVLDTKAAPEEKTANYQLDVPAGASVDVYNPEGSVTMDHIRGDNYIESVNGKVSVSDSAGHVSVRTLKGDIDLTRPTGGVEAISVMGNLRFSGSTSPKLRAQTESGKIVFDGDFVPTGDYVLKSWRGDMDIICSPSDSFELRARTVSGKVDNQLHLSKKSHVPYSYGNGLFGVNNQGDAIVDLKSFSGTIHVKPRGN